MKILMNLWGKYSFIIRFICRETNLYCLIRVHDNSNEETEDHIDEETDECVEVNTAIVPDVGVGVLTNDGERDKHVISVHQRK